MKYQINISGMHCTGCVNLIKMSLEDAGFDNVEVDLNKHIAVFESSREKPEVERLLGITFKELNDYKFSSLKITE
jgi:copper chaperone CopZ